MAPLTSLSMPLPLLPHCLLQIYALLLMRNTATQCQTRLMRESMGRIKRFHGFMASLSVVAPSGGIFLGSASMWDDDDVACSVFLDFTFVVVGFLLPLVLVPLIPAYHGVGGWVKELDTATSGLGKAMQAMCCGRQPGRRPVMTWTQRVLVWFLVIHLMWSWLAILPR